MRLSEPNWAELMPLMEDLLNDWQHLNRLSGSEEAERSVDFLIQRLNALGLSPIRKTCPLYLSDPQSGSLTLPGFPLWQGEAKTRSFSANCPDGVTGTLVVDRRSLQPITECERAGWEAEVRGKIVIADQAFEDYVQRLTRAGALGLVHIWGSAEEALHEETVGPVWGTPVPDDMTLYPVLPVISVNHHQGQKLLEIVNQHQGGVSAHLSTIVHEHVTACSLPVIDIPGESDEFVLLSSHYDSWHEGMTDNATGNALCLAVAAYFHQQQSHLKRGLRIAWWPGHSNARYGGSTWYADHYRGDLQRHCVAHINVDSPGCKEATEVVVNASGAENAHYLNRIIRQVTGKSARRITALGKGGDQSFWGCGIPLHFAFREEPEIRTSQSPGSGGGWWWHTAEDTRDKVDNTILWRDCQIHIGWLTQLLCEEALPVDPDSYLALLIQELDQLQHFLDPQFDLAPIRTELQQLQQQLADFSDWQENKEQRQAVYHAVALWHRFHYSSTDDFHYDRSYRGGAFPGLQILREQRQQTTTPVAFLAMATQFIRQRDRALGLLQQSAEILRKK
ncbi:M28 family peptidase [Erwinia endophytica]|uniref:M28 family peptidase n=1 Tax=Erwinia endophytica TaxID=1563158 RepID=UPI001265D9E7|nr:M28 family peptidase [Erwinia endophytica]KAB8310163.1 M28 family peptidase [Erwinia endophytica]